MHFLDSWTELTPFALARFAAPAALLALAALLPGRRIASLCAAGVALAIAGLDDVGPPLLRAAWVVLWIVVVWRTAGSAAAMEPRWTPTRASRLEAGAIGFLLAVVLLGLLVAGVARQDLAPADSRRASFGLLLLCLGLLHLMLRRDAMRAVVAFATLGLGLQLLEGAAREAIVPPPKGGEVTVLIATAIAVALAARLARERQLDAGSPWVSDAHDLHD